jgi:hypothetical protein
MVVLTFGFDGLMHGVETDTMEDLPRYRVKAACGVVVDPSRQFKWPMDCEDCCKALGVAIPEPVEIKRDRDIYAEAHNRSVSDVG